MAIPAFSYAQTRLQARHGARLSDGAWQSLEAVRSYEQYLQRTRTTGLDRFTARIGGSDGAHTIELRLREAWRAYVEEVARWAPRPWQAATRWCEHLPAVPILAFLIHGGPPLPWMANDPVFGALAAAAPAARRERLAQLHLAALAPAAPRVAHGAATDIHAAWLDHWRTLWPACPHSERHGIEALAESISDTFGALAEAATVEAGDLLRRRLAERIAAQFRSGSGAPPALFCHLALVAADLARLRGGLLHRRLLGPASTEAA